MNENINNVVPPVINNDNAVSVENVTNVCNNNNDKAVSLENVTNVCNNNNDEIGTAPNASNVDVSTLESGISNNHTLNDSSRHEIITQPAPRRSVRSNLGAPPTRFGESFTFGLYV